MPYSDSFYDSKPSAYDQEFLDYQPKSPPYGSKPPPPGSYQDAKPSPKMVFHLPPEDPEEEETNNSIHPNDPEDVPADLVAHDGSDQPTKWSGGNISKKEIYMVATLVGVLVLGTVVLVSVFLIGDKSSSDAAATPAATTFGSFDAGTGEDEPSSQNLSSSVSKYNFLLKELSANPVTATYAERMPLLDMELTSVGSFPSTEADDPHLAAFMRAADWFSHYDDHEDDLGPPMSRFALAVLYYTHGLEYHFKKTKQSPTKNWLSDEHHLCDWEGVDCGYYGSSNNFYELDLSNAELKGEISPALSLLQDLRALWLSYNQLTGTIPGHIFSSMGSLSYLYLQNNNLHGEIPAELRTNGVLGTLVFGYFRFSSLLFLSHPCALLLILEAFFVQGNSLSGTWPQEFCKPCPDCESPIHEFGLNCQQTPCPDGCCSDLDNCYD